MYPLMLKVLCVFRILGRGECFDSCAESTNMSEETIREFFHEFNRKFVEVMYHDVVHAPTTMAEVIATEAQYRARGFPGCTGSVDCVHVA